MLLNEAAYILEYITPSGEEVENYMFISIDDGATDKEITEDLKEELVWVKPENVEKELSYQDLKDMWKHLKEKVYNILEKNN